MMNRIRGSKGFYIKKYDAKKLKFIKDNYIELSDIKIANKLGDLENTVRHWRFTVLGLSKQKRDPSKAPFKIRVLRELNSLLSYNYNGIMKDSVDKRIDFLKKQLSTI